MQSTYLKQQDLLWLKGSAPASAPATLYFGLLDASNAEITATYASARASLTSNTAWSVISTVGINRQISSVLDINFGNGLANGTAPKIGIYTAITGGNLLGILEAKDELGVATPISIVSGSPLVIPSGTVTIAFQIAGFTTYFIDLKLNFLKGTNYPSPPANLYAAVGSITRQAIAWSANVTVGDNLEIRNTNIINFTNASSAFTVSTVGIYDALTAGNLIAQSGFSAIEIANGETKQILANGLRLQV